MLGSPVDIALLCGAALLLFGPKKFPEIGKALGQGIGNFKKALNEAQEEVKSAVKTDEPAQKDKKDEAPAQADAKEKEETSKAAPG